MKVHGWHRDGVIPGTITGQLAGCRSVGLGGDLDGLDDRGCGLPVDAITEHGVEHGQQLAHAGDEGHLGRLAAGFEQRVVRANDRVVLGTGDGRHVEHGPQRAAAGVG